MKKTISNFVITYKGIILIAVTFIFIWAYISYTKPIITNIEYSYNGIKYQAGNLDYAEPISIIIKGVYTKERSSGDIIFKGDILVNGEMSVNGNDGDKYVFNNESSNHTIIRWGDFRGDLFISDMFKEISIDILEPNNKGGYSFSYNNGWIISAPCNNRSEAVGISNKLIQKLVNDVVIK